MTGPDGWLTPAQAAAQFGVSQDTVRRWGASGQLPEHRTPAGHRRYRATDVEAFAARASKGGSSTEPQARATAHPTAHEDIRTPPGNKPESPPSWEKRVKEAEANVDVLKARYEYEEIIEERQRQRNALAEKEAAAAAAEAEARRLQNLKHQGRLQATLAVVPEIWRAKVGQALEQYVTTKYFPPGLPNAEATALVKDTVDTVLRPYREELAAAKEEEEDRLQIERLIQYGESSGSIHTLFWKDREAGDEVEEAVKEALEEQVEADWTRNDVSEFVDACLEEWEEEGAEE